MMKSLSLAVALLMAGAALAADADPFTGIWANTAYQSSGGKEGQKLTITVRGDEETYLSERSDGKGNRVIVTFTARYDNVPVVAHQLDIAPDGTITQRKSMQAVSRRIDGGRRITEHLIGGKVVRRLTRYREPTALISEMEDFDAQGKVTNTAHLVFNANPAKP